MALLLHLALVLAAVTSSAAVAPNIHHSAEACRTLGFDSDTLDCHRCDELAAFFRESTDTSADAVLEAQEAAAVDTDCRACCSDLSAPHAMAGGTQHARVVLEVCTCKFGRYPKVATFVQQHALNHPQLEIKYINARHPFLIFYDADNNTKEEVSIAHWDEATIGEFIDAKVPITASASASATHMDASVSDVIGNDDDKTHATHASDEL